VTLRALEVRGDSLTGLAISRDPNCDPECRVTLALGQVDSVRTATGGSAVSFGFGVVMGFLASITALILLIWGSQLLRS
jgi:hypothetical protein